MPRIPALVALTLALLTAAGCQSLQTAPPAYRFANISRLNAVKPWLTDYATLRPELAPRVNDVVRSWETEVDAQQGRIPTTQSTP
jgi:hypothetical protein